MSHDISVSRGPTQAGLPHGKHPVTWLCWEPEDRVRAGSMFVFYSDCPEGLLHRRVFAECRTGQHPLEESRGIAGQAQHASGRRQETGKACHTKTGCLQELPVTSELAVAPSSALHGLLEKMAWPKVSFGRAQNPVIGEVPKDTQPLGVTGCCPTWRTVGLW